MKKNILLVNCYRERADEKIKGYHEWLQAGATATGLDLAVRDSDDREPLPGSGEFAGVIVSGSQKMVGAGEVEPGLREFLKNFCRPLLGICYGHQALAHSFGALVAKDGQQHLGDEDAFTNRTDPLFADFPPVFKMAESHEEIVVRDNELEKEFMVLAESRQGLVEAIRHRERPLYGVQFHPEKSGELGIRLLENFFQIVRNQE
jgi:GMP synthase-like glutamine amidotransferase